MANRIKIATFSVRPFEVDMSDSHESVTQACLDFWTKKFDLFFFMGAGHTHAVVVPGGDVG